MHKNMMGIKITKLGQETQKKKLSVPLAGQSRKRSRREETRPGGQCLRDRRGRAAIKTKVGTLERGAGVGDSTRVYSTSFPVTQVHAQFTGREPRARNVHAFSGGLFRVPGPRLVSRPLSPVSSP